MEDEGQDTGEAEPRTKVIFQIGADSEVESEVKSDYPEDQHLPQGGDHLSVGGMSMSCLSVPVSYAEAQVDLSNPQRTRKLCSSMPSVRSVDLYLFSCYLTFHLRNVPMRYRIFFTRDTWLRKQQQVAKKSKSEQMFVNLLHQIL
jgi:hypothetical protein